MSAHELCLLLCSKKKRKKDYFLLIHSRIFSIITANITGTSRYVWLRARTATRRLLINSRPHATNIASMCGYCYRKGDKKHFKISKPVSNGNTFPRVGSALRCSVKSATIGFSFDASCWELLQSQSKMSAHELCLLLFSKKRKKKKYYFLPIFSRIFPLPLRILFITTANPSHHHCEYHR